MRLVRRFGARGGVGIGATCGTSSRGGSGPEAVIGASGVTHVGIAVSSGGGGGGRCKVQFSGPGRRTTVSHVRCVGDSSAYCLQKWVGSAGKMLV